MKKRVFITGVTGQDGYILSKYLTEECENYIVYGLIRRVSSYNTKINELEKIGVEIIEGDITDLSSLARSLKVIRPDYFYGFAAQSYVRGSFDEPVSTFNITANGTLNCLEAIRTIDKNIRYYQASSSEQFGKVQETPQKETTPFYPRSPYGCFIAGTKILFKKKEKSRFGGYRYVLGNKNIENVATGDMVFSYNTISGKKEYKEVLNIQKRDTNEIYIINLSNGNKLECTEEHPFFIPLNGWVEAKKLKIGDEVIQYKYSGLNLRICDLNRRGKTISEEQKIKIRKSNKDFSEKNIKGKKYEEIYGREKSDNIKKKLSIIGKKKKTKKWKLSEETKNKMKGRKVWNSGLTKESDNRIKKISDKLFGRIINDKQRELISNTLKQLWLDPEYRKKQLKTQQKKQNKCEILVSNILNENFNGQFKYVGNRALFIGQPPRNPDWVHIEKDKVIEYFGRHWHKDEDEFILKEHYKKCGYDCLVIWEEELKNINKLISKIKEFLYNPDVEIVKITSIEIKNVQCKVYNFEVKDNNNYFANGILVHNCAKLAAYWLTINYRESYNIFASNGILFNHESEQRGINFVTRKITDGVARIKNGLQDKLELGNLDSERDWMYAKDAVIGAKLILEHTKPDDFILCSGEKHSVREFCEICFRKAGLGDYNKYVITNQKHMRPTEVDILLGDCSKAKNELGWELKTSFEEMIDIMLKNDLERYANKGK